TRRRSAAAAVPLRSANAPLDARQLYMNQIQAIPVLGREAVAQLSDRIHEQQALFECSLLEIPGAALRVVEEWESRRSRAVASPRRAARSPCTTSTCSCSLTTICGSSQSARTAIAVSACPSWIWCRRATSV